MTYKKALEDSLAVQDACNISGVARSMVNVIDAVRAHGGDARKHPAVYLFAYKMLALTGYEALQQWGEYETAENAVKIEIAAIVAADDILAAVDQGDDSDDPTSVDCAPELQVSFIPGALLVRRQKL